MLLLFNGLFLALFIILLIIFYISYHINSKWYKNKKYITYISVISSIATAILAIGVLFQIIAYQSEQYKNTIQSYTNFSKDFITYIIEMFKNYPQMNYYYNQLFFNEPIPNNTQRDIVLEQQISMIIISKSVEQIAIIKEFPNNKDVNNIKQVFLKILGNFFKSPIFTNYYVNYFKPNIAGPIVIEFIYDNFGV